MSDLLDVYVRFGVFWILFGVICVLAQPNRRRTKEVKRK